MTANTPEGATQPRAQRRGRLRALLVRPYADVMAAIESLETMPRLALAIAATMGAWWLYVPVHELLHAAGCVATGGSVTRLEIARLYGGDLLAGIFPWVTAGSEYAGRLSGFDTGGSDVVYFATTLAPYLLTIFPGVTLLAMVPRVRASRRALLLGAALVLAMAPFMALTGDCYELGSILVSRAAIAGGAGEERALAWRGDDLALVVGGLHGRGAGAGDFAGVAASLVAGIGVAFAVYWVGVFVAGRFVKASPGTDVLPSYRDRGQS